MVKPIGHARLIRTQQVGDIVHLNSDFVTVTIDGDHFKWSRFLVELIEFGEYYENEQVYIMGNVVERKGILIVNTFN